MNKVSPRLDVLGATGPDPLGPILGGDYLRFRSPTGLAGLARESEGRLDVLALYSPKPQPGQLLRFFDLAKAIYKTICVWHGGNPSLERALTRYGFTPATEIQGQNVLLTGSRWDAP